MRYALASTALLLVALVVVVRGAVGASTDRFTPCAGAALQDSSAGASSPVTFTWGVGAGPDCVLDRASGPVDDYMIEDVIHFIPREWGVRADADFPDGVEVGSLTAQTTLGLLNNPCTNLLPVNFTMYEATTRQDDTIEALPPGTTDRLSPIGGGNPPAGALKWPTYLTEYMINLGADASKLHARYMGVARIAAANNLTAIAQLLVFPPGARIDSQLPLNTSAHYSAVLVVQDPAAPASSQDFINNICSPLRAELTLEQVLTNPGEGKYSFATVLTSAPDADRDGIENALDTCPLDVNVGNPRRNPDIGDRDRDGIDEACDPGPGPGCGGFLCGQDEDFDLWLNRADNCPLVANEDQADADGDGIGDACDRNPDVVDGVGVTRCIDSPITVGTGGAAYSAPCDAILNPPAEPCPAGDAGCSPLPTLSPAPTPTPNPVPAALPRTGGGPGGG